MLETFQVIHVSVCYWAELFNENSIYVLILHIIFVSTVVGEKTIHVLRNHQASLNNYHGDLIGSLLFPRNVTFSPVATC